jgi:protein-S-isoprenylcysteine O-methyltransferase Ste14
VSYPRWVAFVSTPLLFVLVHVLLPYEISRLSVHHGWVGGYPGPWNLLALIVVVIGAAGIVWGAGLHVLETSPSFEMETTPRYLLKGGPYRFSRNPIYLAVLTMWLGWALVYGSIANAVAWVIAWAIIRFVVVPWEERGLERRFGGGYLQYKNTVPRWFGRASTAGEPR